MMELPEEIKKLNKLIAGEEVTCTSCGKGIYDPVGGDYKTTYCFKCSACGSMINLN